MTITNEMYEYVLSDDNLNDLQFGYAGGGKLLCVSSFRNNAGCYATERLVGYEFGKNKGRGLNLCPCF